jgi:hypothetical protein
VVQLPKGHGFSELRRALLQVAGLTVQAQPSVAFHLPNQGKGNLMVRGFSCQDGEHVARTFLFLPLSVCLLVPSVALPEVQISVASRMLNSPPGRCGWCALETLARHLSIKALYGIVEKHPANSRPKDLESAVAATGARYRIQCRGNRNTEILRNAIDENLGAVVGFRPLVSGERGHIVTLVEFGDAEVRILDPNDGKVRTMGLEAFLKRWDGFALVLERP